MDSLIDASNKEAIKSTPIPGLHIVANLAVADIPKLVQQIEKRGRDFEYSIRLDYLGQLNKHYESWIGNYNDGKLLIIDVDHLDFVENIDDFSFIVNKIDLELNNLFG